MVERIAVTTNAHGLYLLNEHQFIASMLSGKMKELLAELHASDRINATGVPSRKSSTKRMSLIASKLIKTKSVLSSKIRNEKKFLENLVKLSFYNRNRL